MTRELYGDLVAPRLGEITEWMRLGLSMGQVAKKLGVARETLCGYQTKYPELRQAILNARLDLSDVVMDAMFKRATGYTVKLLKQKANMGKVLDAYEEAHYPADVSAADLVLRNNLPGYKTSKDNHGILNMIQVNVEELKDELKIKRENISKLEKVIEITRKRFDKVGAREDENGNIVDRDGNILVKAKSNDFELVETYEVIESEAK